MLKKSPQLSLFNDNNFEEDYTINLEFDRICGNILNVVGSILIIKCNNTINLYDFKRLEGYIIDFI